MSLQELFEQYLGCLLDRHALLELGKYDEYRELDSRTNFALKRFTNSFIPSDTDEKKMFYNYVYDKLYYINTVIDDMITEKKEIPSIVEYERQIYENMCSYVRDYLISLERRNIKVKKL